MRNGLLALGALVTVLFGLLGAGCSGSSTGGFGFMTGPDGGLIPPGGGPDATVLGNHEAGMILGGPDSAVATGCTGLACQQTCSTTTVTGKVYDPAGVNGLYNVFVYVPNAPLAAITSGPTCTACQAPASGDPIASTSTAADGTFTLTNVPSGTNIPIVLQLGKWRRHLTLPAVASCATTTPADGFFRFPKKQAETSPDDNIPLIAFTTGCDGAECFFLGRVGIDPSEFTGPNGVVPGSSPPRPGRVQIYKSGNDDGQTFPGGAGDAATLWATGADWMKYDMVFDACECSTYDRGGAGSTDVGYVNFLNYLNAGGRAFTTHYFYNFFADEQQCDGAIGGGFGSSDCYGQAALPTVGAWEQNSGQAYASDAIDCPKDTQLNNSPSGLGGSCLTIDTSVPKGVAFAQWYQDNNAKLTFGGGEKYGYVGLTDIRQDMGPLASSLVSAGSATPWLYAGNLTSQYDAYYFSFNTPISTNTASQCGRAIFSDVHLDDAPSGAFPSYCAADPNASDHAPNELALEFLFFDLSSCVQNDNMSPPPPPPSK
jgi:hypothetical protein